MKFTAPAIGSRKIAPSPNSNVNRKSNSDLDRGQFSEHPTIYILLKILLQ